VEEEGDAEEDAMQTERTGKDESTEADGMDEGELEIEKLTGDALLARLAAARSTRARKHAVVPLDDDAPSAREQPQGSRSKKSKNRKRKKMKMQRKRQKMSVRGQ
jgi:hypothetical protein